MILEKDLPEIMKGDNGEFLCGWCGSPNIEFGQMIEMQLGNKKIDVYLVKCECSKASYVTAYDRHRA